MKKFLWLLLVLVLFLAACDGAADEITRLEETIAWLESERGLLTDAVSEKTLEISELQALVAELEEQQYAGDAAQDEILDSFMNNLNLVSGLLGIDDLYIAEEDIILHGNFATARSDDMYGGLELIFQYWRIGDEIRWVLLEYAVNWVSGPGFLDGGRSWWQLEQEEFEESFTVRFYRYEDYDIYEYFDEEISPQDWQRQVIDHMRAINGIRLADLWYEDYRLVADLTPAGAVPFNWGSTGGGLHTQMLINSLATMPNVTEIEVLVGGQRGVWADHANFAIVFRVTEDVDEANNEAQ